MSLLHAIFLVAITAEAMSGAIMGMRRRMDLFGIAFIGTVTGLGGGTARDVLLGHYPLTWVGHPEYLLFTVGAAIATAYVARNLHRFRKLFLMVDGLGLVAFTVIGCNVAMEMGLHPAVAVISGMITGVFGGLLRDVLCNQVPLVLRRDFYATVAILSGVLYVALVEWGMGTGPASIIALVVGFLFRVLAVTFRWRLPSFDGDGLRGLD